MEKNESPEKKTHGFTLLELMAVVFIISILAAIALPLVNKYLKKSKTTEAGVNIRKIYDGEVSYYQEERTSQDGTVISKRFVAASASPSVPGTQKQLGNFSTVEWESLKFAPDGPVLYSYSAITSGLGLSAEFTARAEGDIDGDGETSLFERVGLVNDTTGEVEGGAALYTFDDLE